MSKAGRKILGSEEISRLSSTYLSQGRRQEEWEITYVEIDDDVLKARIRMRTRYISPTDPGGFHLTIFSTLEFLSQLAIIYVHVWAGLTEKTREGWMLECSINSKQSIRDPENIQVIMKIPLIRNIRNKIIVTAESRVFDDNGQFQASMKCILS